MGTVHLLSAEGGFANEILHILSRRILAERFPVQALTCGAPAGLPKLLRRILTPPLVLLQTRV